MKEINIAMTTADDELFWVMVVAVESILSYIPGETRCIFHIMTTDYFDADKKASVENLTNKYSNGSFKWYEVGKHFQSANNHTQNLGINIQTFYRLIIPEIIKADRCLYLDIDIVCCGDITELYSIDLGSYMIAGVKAPGYINNPNPTEYCKRNNLPGIDEYINAGVVLMNLKALREERFAERALNEIGKFYDSQDQDIINKLCYGRIMHLPLRYNLPIMQYERHIENYGEAFDIVDVNKGWSAPLIVHYAGPIKPWNDYRCIYGERWWAVCLQSDSIREFVGAQSAKMIESAIFGNKHYNPYDWKRLVWNKMIFEKKIFLYGAGYVANNISQVLKAEGIEYQGVVVSDLNNTNYVPGDNVFGVPIEGIGEDAEKHRDALYIVCVMDDKKMDVIHTLIKNRCFKFLPLNNGSIY